MMSGTISGLSPRIHELRESVLESAEDRPGTYRMVGADGEHLYVGKSVRIRTRLLSYFRAADEEKAARIIARTHQLEWDYTPNEFAALLQELHQIRRWRPTYNVEHNREREYSFIKLTNGPAPRLLVTCRVTSDGARYYGPFYDRRRLREAVRELSDLLQLRDCAERTPIHFADQTDLFSHRPDALCIRADLDRCLAPCAARCTLAEYSRRVEEAQRFLEGDTDQPLSILYERMHAAAERLDFEYAGLLRDRAERLAALQAELVEMNGMSRGSAFLYPVRGTGGEDIVYLLGHGLVLDEFPAPDDDEGWDELREVAGERVGGVASYRQYLTPDNVPESILIARWFRRRPEEWARLIPLES